MRWAHFDPIHQQGTQVSITRTSPTLHESCSVGNRAITESGRIFGQTLSFVIVGDTIRGTMNSTQGAFDVYESLPTATAPSGSPKAICHAADHTLTLRRR